MPFIISFYLLYYHWNVEMNILQSFNLFVVNIFYYNHVFNKIITRLVPLFDVNWMEFSECLKICQTYWMFLSYLYSNFNINQFFMFLVMFSNICKKYNIHKCIQEALDKHNVNICWHLLLLTYIGSSFRVYMWYINVSYFIIFNIYLF